MLLTHPFCSLNKRVGGCFWRRWCWCLHVEVFSTASQAAVLIRYSVQKMHFSCKIESRKCHARSNFIKMTVWVPPTFCCFVHLVNDSHHSYYSYFIITPLGKATQVRMWPRWLTRHNRRKWINRRWKKAKAGSIVWVGSLVGVYPTKSGWWLGTWVLFSHILGIIIPTDFDIFQRGWNHQPDWIWLLGDSGQVNFSSGDHCQSYWMFFFLVL